MKKMILTAITALSTQTMAFVDMPTYPNENDWAKAMTEKACKMKFSSSAVGIITEQNNGTVLYTVYSKSGQVLAQAVAQSSFIGAKKKCLN